MEIVSHTNELIEKGLITSQNFELFNFYMKELAETVEYGGIGSGGIETTTYSYKFIVKYRIYEQLYEKEFQFENNLCNYKEIIAFLNKEILYAEHMEIKSKEEIKECLREHLRLINWNSEEMPWDTTTKQLKNINNALVALLEKSLKD